MGLLAWFDRHNARWAERKIVRERSLRAEAKSPVIATPYGLYSVSVVDLESEPSMVEILPIPLAIVVGIVRWISRSDRQTSDGRRLRFEAQVVALDYPRERRVAGAVFRTYSEADAMRTRYEERLRTGWNPTDT